MNNLDKMLAQADAERLTAAAYWELTIDYVRSVKLTHKFDSLAGAEHAFRVACSLPDPQSAR